MNKRVCPEDPKHKRFHVTAHVTEEWIVDEHGNFMEVTDRESGQVVHRPDHGDIWTCAECGCSETEEG